MMIEKSTKITLNDYILTNIDLETLCFTIRLKDEKEYIVYHKKIKIDGRIKTINYIKKDDKIMLLEYAIILDLWSVFASSVQDEIRALEELHQIFFI